MIFFNLHRLSFSTGTKLGSCFSLWNLNVHSLINRFHSPFFPTHSLSHSVLSTCGKNASFLSLPAFGLQASNFFTICSWPCFRCHLHDSHFSSSTPVRWIMLEVSHWLKRNFLLPYICPLRISRKQWLIFVQKNSNVFELWRQP